jgi:hypothetical protein
MNISDFISYNDEPKCLFCKNKLRLLTHISTSYRVEYNCYECNEGCTVVYNKIGAEPTFFVFSCLNKDIAIHLDTNLFSIDLHENRGIAVPVNYNKWYPCFKFNFEDKNKLNDKINTLLTFS